MKGKWIKACALAGALSMMTVALGEQVDLLEVDHRLYELGYRDSACKGELNEVTVNALRNFQQVNGLEVTGEPDSATVSLLMSDAAVDQETYLVSMVQQNMQMQPLSNGSYGEDVARLQRELYRAAMELIHAHWRPGAPIRAAFSQMLWVTPPTDMLI